MSNIVGTTQTDAQLIRKLWGRIAELERHNKLLKAAVIVAEQYDVQGKPFWEALQAAVDGGAIEIK